MKMMIVYTAMDRPTKEICFNCAMNNAIQFIDINPLIMAQAGYGDTPDSRLRELLGLPSKKEIELISQRNSKPIKENK